MPGREPERAAREPLIIVGKYAGFCWGVERAIKMARETAAREGRLNTIGPLVHNEGVVRELASEGIEPADSVAAVTTPVALIRTHGLPPAALREAEQRGLQLVDATCPTVATVPRRARQLVEEGYDLYIVGQARHPEIVALLGCVEGRATVVETPEEAERLTGLGRIGIVGQTTLPASTFKHIVSILSSHAQEAKVFDTLCRAALANQAEAEQIARRVDLVLVIGSPQSANTRHLAQVAEAAGAKVALVADPNEVTAQLIGPYRRIGITGGASTPKPLIREVEARVRRLLQEAGARSP